MFKLGPFITKSLNFAAIIRDNPINNELSHFD